MFQTLFWRWECIKEKDTVLTPSLRKSLLSTADKHGKKVTAQHNYSVMNAKKWREESKEPKK